MLLFWQKPIWLLLLAAVGGLVLVVWGSDVTVDAATNIAKAIGMSERFIGLTIVALGTSLPELFTSVSAAMKGKADIAIGNIVGSNIFNILLMQKAKACETGRNCYAGMLWGIFRVSFDVVF